MPVKLDVISDPEEQDTEYSQPALPICLNPLEVKHFMNEEKRLQSFRKWQHGDRTLALVKNGFYLNDEETEIICVECDYKVETHQLVKIDARQSHKKNSPNCGQIAIGNQYVSEITGFSNYAHPGNDCESDEQNDYQHTSQERVHTICNNTTAVNSVQLVGRSPSNTDYRTPRSNHPQCSNSTHGIQMVPKGAESNVGELRRTIYSDLHKREDTFSTWDHSIFQDTNALSISGFYFTGETDALRCFSCDIELTDWKPTDDPWVQHARRSPSCAFLKENKSQEFIDNVQRDWSQMSERIKDLGHNITTECSSTDPQNDVLIQQIQNLEVFSKDVGELLISGFKIYPNCINLILKGTELNTVLQEIFGQPEIQVAFSITIDDKNKPRRKYTYEFGDNLKYFRFHDLPVTPHFTYAVKMLGLDVVNQTLRKQCIICIMTVTFAPDDDTNKNTKCDEKRKRTLIPRCEQLTSRKSNKQNMHEQLNSSDHSENQTIVDTVYSAPHSRDATFRYWDRNKFHNASLLSAAGFYFTGEMDAVRCFSCDIGLADWKPTDDPWLEHARHSPSCTFLKENKSQEFIDKVQHDWSQVYKARHPKYNELSERIKSFENSGWPQYYVRQTPSELAEAGLFYTGETDTVRCHYCDGGLRDLEPEDNPWIEHGRWFSFCKFVIRQKGLPFIQECGTGNGSRPATSEPYVSKNLPESYTNQDYETSEEKWRKIGLENPLKTAAAMSVKEMGYSNATVKSAINTYIARTGTRDFDASSLLQIIFDLEEQGHILPDDTNTTSGKSDSESENEFELTPQAIVKENKVMKIKFSCIGCKTKERTNVFVPCGHRLMCEDCAKKQTRCCHCETDIQRTVKTFLV